jgi:hypothetical protein
MIQRRRMFLIGLLSLLGSCTYTEPRVRPEPAMILPAPGIWYPCETRIPPANTTQNPITYHCAESHAASQRVFGSVGDLVAFTSSRSDECIYVYIDPRELPDVSPGGTVDPSILANDVGAVLQISDYNCTNFLSRAFALKTSTGFFRSLINGAVSSTAAVISLAGAPALVTSGISAGNAVIGGGVDSLNSEYFAGQTFNAFETGIRARREVLLTNVRQRLCATEKEKEKCVYANPPPSPLVQPLPYLTLQDALVDVAEYDQACSFEEGLAQLTQGAAAQKQAADEVAGKPIKPRP